MGLLIYSSCIVVVPSRLVDRNHVGYIRFSILIMFPRTVVSQWSYLIEKFDTNIDLVPL